MDTSKYETRLAWVVAILTLVMMVPIMALGFMFDFTRRAWAAGVDGAENLHTWVANNL